MKEGNTESRLFLSSQHNKEVLVSNKGNSTAMAVSAPDARR
jgi:hypothetical protein